MKIWRAFKFNGIDFFNATQDVTATWPKLYHYMFLQWCFLVIDRAGVAIFFAAVAVYHHANKSSISCHDLDSQSNQWDCTLEAVRLVGFVGIFVCKILKLNFNNKLPMTLPSRCSFMIVTKISYIETLLLMIVFINS